ncbi:MAG TPA: hypothetical protein VGC22_06225, partial [Chitinophaga sp.]
LVPVNWAAGNLHQIRNLPQGVTVVTFALQAGADGAFHSQFVRARGGNANADGTAEIMKAAAGVISGAIAGKANGFTLTLGVVSASPDAPFARVIGKAFATPSYITGFAAPVEAVYNRVIFIQRSAHVKITGNLCQ